MRSCDASYCCKSRKYNCKQCKFTTNSKSTLKTLKAISDASDEIKTEIKFLWLNKSVNYQSKPIFNDEFFKAGLYDFYQLVKTNGDLFSCNEMAKKFKMTPNNRFFIKYIKLISAIPVIW